VNRVWPMRSVPRGSPHRDFGCCGFGIMRRWRTRTRCSPRSSRRYTPPPHPSPIEGEGARRDQGAPARHQSSAPTPIEGEGTRRRPPRSCSLSAARWRASVERPSPWRERAFVQCLLSPDGREHSSRASLRCMGERPSSKVPPPLTGEGFLPIPSPLVRAGRHPKFPLPCVGAGFRSVFPLPWWEKARVRGERNQEKRKKTP
jgi:hypothetical protein